MGLGSFGIFTVRSMIKVRRERVAVGWTGDLGMNMRVAALAPAGGAHFLDEAELDLIDGAVGA
jgi:hypothetical protein